MVLNGRQKFTRRIKVRDNFTCRHCGRHNSELLGVPLKNRLTIHHIKPQRDYPKLKYDLDNIILLCSECHSKVHKEDRRKKSLKMTFKIFYGRVFLKKGHWYNNLINLLNNK